MFFTDVARIAVVRRRALSSTAVAVLAAALVLGGCASPLTRQNVTPEQQLKLRTASDEQATETGRRVIGRVLDRTKAQYDEYAAGKQSAPPTIDVLIISGGGDWGAFGAGFLKGWAKVPPQHRLAKPEFDAVTGVSTGTLIAPFAFLGDPQSADAIVNLYRNPQPDWVKRRGVLFFLPDNISFAEVPGLEREVQKYVTTEMVSRVAAAGADGRLLAVNTTNLDEGTSRVFDLVAEAQQATRTGKLDRIHNIMLASAGIPGAFPFRMIDDQLYVDGGVTGNIIYGGRIGEEDSIPAQWQTRYPNVPIPRIRFWVLFNNQLRPLPELTAPNWPAVIQRSMDTSTRAATTTAVRHLFAIAEISRLKRKAEVEVRVASIPGDWFPPVPGIFQKETMNSLADLGEKMGEDPASWSSEPPGF